MNADQLLKEAKELQDLYGIYIEDTYIYQVGVTKCKKQAKDLLTSIKNGEIEGCGKDEHPEWIIPYICGKTMTYKRPTDEKGKLHICRNCQQKINEAEKILREVLE